MLEGVALSQILLGHAEGVEIRHLSLGGLPEAAANQVLAVRTQAMTGTYVAPYLLMIAARRFPTSGGFVITPAIMLGMTVNATSPGADLALTTQDGTGFTFIPRHLSPVSGQAGGGLEVGREKWLISAHYSAMLAENWHAQSIQANFKMTFYPSYVICPVVASFALRRVGWGCNLWRMDFSPPYMTSKMEAHQRAAGQLDIALADKAGQTRLTRFYQQGCLKARRVGHGDTPELVAMNISGGIAGGDSISMAFELGENAKAVFTTQAAERIYRSLGDPAYVSTKLFAASGASLAYLPQETILFDGFSLDRSLEIDLSEGATFIGVESLVFGRLAMGEVVQRGLLRDKINIRCNGRLIWRDVATVKGHIFSCLNLPGVGGAARVAASLFAVGQGFSEMMPQLRQRLEGHVAGVSSHGGIVFVRLLAEDTITLRLAVMAALSTFGRKTLPRVWLS
ncbi:Urease accessory protein UreH [Acidocella aminolytica 101 = DSM 11237]|uniref:Urease accessory protein UreD n=2 Tax=Acidocella TaxID=50709 RepID=A0A0D6PBV6_9PROT|nr:urease accessory protein UreD [Acidocella aminolytica 101 = DSM 11237]GBQ39761.1 hypothetical protein AA11237_2176 [Acidocella aminolytica 101 = DSM 11237]SHE36561.1 Urease accessory protein UreH [Acidocella aminolytica 101 = DSM 11237]